MSVSVALWDVGGVWEVRGAGHGRTNAQVLDLIRGTFAPRGPWDQPGCFAPVISFRPRGPGSGREPLAGWWVHPEKRWVPMGDGVDVSCPGEDLTEPQTRKDGREATLDDSRRCLTAASPKCPKALGHGSGLPGE